MSPASKDMHATSRMNESTRWVSPKDRALMSETQNTFGVRTKSNVYPAQVRYDEQRVHPFTSRNDGKLSSRRGSLAPLPTRPALKLPDGDLMQTSPSARGFAKTGQTFFGK